MISPVVRSVLERFLKSDTPEVLAIKGAWGVGKTHAWNKVVLDCKDAIKLPNYCYVSLFGMSSISDLRVAILAKTVSPKDLGKEITWTSDLSWTQAGSFFRRALNLLSAARELSGGKAVSIAVETVAPHLISKTIVCLDDFERLSNRLFADEVLGFVSGLKEEKACKVVLIFNEEKLGENVDTYKRYREKLVDFEVLYAPSPEQAADLVFAGGLPWHMATREKTIALGITNIRLLRKIARLAEGVYAETKQLHDGVFKSAVATIVLISWCYYEPDESKPTIEFIREFTTMQYAFKRHQAKKENKELDPKEKRHAELLERYGFANLDELDLAIIKAVDQGYTDGTNLLAEALKLDARLKAGDLEQSFSMAWRLFHDTFANNQKELVEALSSSFKKGVEQITQMNANGTVKLLRELGEDAVADELIEYYIDKRKDQTELFDMDSYAFGGEITDTKLRERFKETFRKARPLPSIADAALALGSSQGYNSEDLEALDGATEDDLYKLFKADTGDNHIRIVRGCIIAGGIGGHEALGGRVRAVLEKIAAESPLNAIRVGRYLKQSQ